MSRSSLAKLADALRAQLAGEAAAWLHEALDAVGADPTAIRSRFPAVGRKVGRAPLAGGPGGDQAPWTADEAARALLLAGLGTGVVDELAELYHHGDGAERRAILRALDLLPVDDRALALVLDALRTNDDRLVAAAMGSYATERLPEAAFRHAVLKFVFMGLPLAAIPGLEARADAALARMLAAYAHERVAAGRDVPADLWPLIERFPPEAELAAIADEVHGDAGPRRQAAVTALAEREASRQGS
ncbi:MAG: EboA domain-containing protein [Actinomycetota bacterium]|nr:EboA domain-containing protein [Actinomycetota bacterium]